ncbi:MAG: fasciclin domain-containing protein, partial [Bacteroidales bacterium]|nr:fasciclin domain-containing protein [Bacteroidales bacterium]
MVNSLLKRNIYAACLGLIAFSFLFSSCQEELLNDSYYTFTGQTVGEYLEETEEFSEFYNLLNTTQVIGLLRAYGEYTCFVPDNAAMTAYYEANGKQSLQDFTIEELKKTAYHHIIQDTLTTSQFIEGFQAKLTMSGRYLNIEFDSDSSELIFHINEASTITSPNRIKHNGIVHVIDHVISPTEYTLVEQIAKEKKFSLFSSALIATGLDKQIALIEDLDYRDNVPDMLAGYKDGDLDHTGIYVKIPKERKYGYTALIESDSTYASNGITTLAQLEAEAKRIYDQVYPNDKDITDITDRRNSLNRFVAYHLLNKKIPKQLFIEKFDHTGATYDADRQTHSVQTYDMFEYMETLCPNALMEVRTNRATAEHNLFNATGVSEDGLIMGDVVRLTENYDNDALNGVFHEIDGLLSYNLTFVAELSTKRLRMDAASFFPEMTNNNMRNGSIASGEVNSYWYLFPPGYLERVKASETTIFGYITPHDQFLDNQGDEVFLGKTKGGPTLYDFEIETLPVPAGTYEVRFGYQPTGARGAAQLYWDGQPTGIPLDLRLSADNEAIGFVQPYSQAATNLDDYYGYENDKMMRNRGYMKGGASYKVIKEGWYEGTGRTSIALLRRIIGTNTFTEAS